MKENVLDVLMYLFENYIDSELDMFPDQDSLRIELMDAGFTHTEVEKAFTWLEGLASLKESSGDNLPSAKHAIRMVSCYS